VGRLHLHHHGRVVVAAEGGDVESGAAPGVGPGHRQRRRVLRVEAAVHRRLALPRPRHVGVLREVETREDGTYVRRDLDRRGL
jgi:hypothetical protein